jgi:TolB-like protein
MPFKVETPITPSKAHRTAEPELETAKWSASTESVNAELVAVCNSAGMSSAPRLKKLLTFLVEETLAGNPLKESILGVAVFGRRPGYDPKQDSVVRTEVRRLRAKLIEYYAGEGIDDRLIIDLPKGSYVPVFLERRLAPAEDQQAPSSDPPVTSTPPAVVPKSRNGPQRWAVWAAIVALVGALLVLIWVRQPKFATGTASAAAAQRRSVAVLEFRDLTARHETAWLANAIPEMISADLGAGSKVRTIPGENVSQMATDLALQPSASPSAATLTAIRRILGADIVVSGAYADLGTQDGGRVRLDVRAQDTKTGEVIASVSESGGTGEILDVVSRAGARLRDGLLLEDAALGDQAVREATPKSTEAARDYTDGLALLRHGDLLQGRNLLKECARIDPDFALGHAALSDANAKLGYESEAREEARRAYELSRSLTSEESQRSIEAQFRLLNAEPARAAEIYAGLFAKHPDDIEIGLQLTAAQRKADQTAGALGTIQVLRKLPEPESLDPRIDMAAAYAMADHADYRQSAALAADAARKASAANAKLLYAHAISLESGLDWYLGDARWRNLSEEARAICEQFGDKACVAAVFRRIGNADFSALNLESADRNFAQALEIARQIGSLAEEMNVLNGMALVSHARGDLKQSQDIEDRLAMIGKQTGNQRLEQASEANLGDTLFEEGQIEAAQQKIEAALKIARAVGDRAAIADDLVSLAEMDRIRGDLGLAGKTCDEGLGLSREAAMVNAEVPALAAKTRTLLAADDLAGAQAAFQEYNRLQKTGVNISAFADRSLPVAMALATGQTASAAALAAALVHEAADQRMSTEQALAEALLAESLYQDKPKEARDAAESAWARVRGSQHRLARLEVGITRARVTGRSDFLPNLIAEAHSRHAYELELEARMTSAQLERRSEDLAALRSEALSRGFKYLVRSSYKRSS